MIMKRNNPPGINRQGASTAVREKPQTATASQKTDSKNTLKVIPLGGIEEVGENMTIMEYGDDILVIDMGLGFPDEILP
ncbi:MAG: ribonuclease J, partial [Candidatus Doudnabacteria bacterium]|nr:ribonuclease J [Candidatus Doudnabacteria bacterium]